MLQGARLFHAGGDKKKIQQIGEAKDREVAFRKSLWRASGKLWMSHAFELQTRTHHKGEFEPASRRRHADGVETRRRKQVEIVAPGKPTRGSAHQVDRFV